MSERPGRDATGTRVLAFAVGLAVVFGLALGVGRIADPDTAPVADHDAGGGHTGHGHAVEPASVHLALAARSSAPGADVPVSFQVQDHDGTAVTSYDLKHEKDLHLIVLGTRDLTDFQHVHPTRAADGTWTAHVRLAPGTSYRLYADGSTGGSDFVATGDLFTTGSSPAPAGVPEPSTREQVDGFTVELDQRDGVAALRVTKAGAAVTLEPYLGALGHLVVIRADDLSYLHVHPEEGATPAFMVAGLAPGRYRYFFDFQVDGVVHTAAFTHVAGESMPMGTEEQDHDGH
jgi:hypothetical protein